MGLRDQESCSSQIAMTQESSCLDTETDICRTQMVDAWQTRIVV